MKPPRKPDAKPATPTDWGNVADWYDGLVGDEGSEFHRQVIFPGVLKLLAIQKGEEVLDIACGQGVLCRVLRQHGAKPTGIDAAPELIKIARERDPEGRYHITDAKDLSSVTADHYSAAACVLAIQNIDTLPPVFEGVSRALKANGRFVLVMMHPCFRNPKETYWGWDEEEKVQFRRVDRYLLPRKEPIVTHPGQKTGEYTWSFHRPISMYFKSLRNAGLVVDALEEWASHKTSTSGPRAGAENVARKEIPMFLAIRALKLGR